jgi:hypothetical protein
MVASDQHAEFVIRGMNERSPGVLGGFLTRLESYLESLERAVFRIDNLILADSVHITIAPTAGELERARAAYRAALELDPEDPVRTKRLQDAVPPTFVAADLAVEQLERAERGEPIESVVAYGRGATERLRSLTRLLADEGLQLEATSAVAPRHVQQNDEDLERVARRLESVGEIETFEIRVAGVVTMADSDQRRFRLKIADDTTIPPALRNVRNRRLSGPYTARAGRILQDEGLWNKEIIATIRVERQRRETTGKMRSPKYTLVGARTRFG